MWRGVSKDNKRLQQHNGRQQAALVQAHGRHSLTQIDADWNRKWDLTSRRWQYSTFSAGFCSSDRIDRRQTTIWAALIGWGCPALPQALVSNQITAGGRGLVGSPDASVRRSLWTEEQLRGKRECLGDGERRVALMPKSEVNLSSVWGCSPVEPRASPGGKLLSVSARQRGSVGR